MDSESRKEKAMDRRGVEISHVTKLVAFLEIR